MRHRQYQMWALGLGLVVLFAGTTPLSLTAEDGESEVHRKRVHRVVVKCEGGSEEDCERQIHIESQDDGSQVMHVGDHEMAWVEAGGHGYHYSIGSDLAGKGGFLGVQLTDLTPELRTHFGVAADEGVMVAKVVDDSAAFRAGLAAGDIITRVDGEAVSSSSALTHAIRSRQEGDAVNLEIWRDGSAEMMTATLDRNEPMAGFRRHVMIDCGEDDENCSEVLVARGHHGMAIDCPDGEECEVEIDCDDGECDCTLNGEAIDCEELHAEHGPQD